MSCLILYLTINFVEAKWPDFYFRTFSNVFPHSSYNLMVKCWMDDPVDRPTFTEIVKNMEHMLENISGYLQLSDLMAKACVPSIKETDMEAQENSHYEHDSTA